MLEKVISALRKPIFPINPVISDISIVAMVLVILVFGPEFSKLLPDFIISYR